MSTIDNWKKGFCPDGCMDVSVTLNEILAGNRKNVAANYACNRSEECKRSSECRYSTERIGNGTFVPNIFPSKY